MVKKYPSDLSADQFSEIKELIPQALKGGRGRSVDVKKVRYILYTKEWVPMAYVTERFSTMGNSLLLLPRWQREGVYNLIYSNLYKKIRAQANKESPYIGIMDSQSVKTTEKGGLKAITDIRK